MSKSKKSVSPIITLGHKASVRFAALLKAGPTEQQQKSFSQSLGTFSLYQKKWQAKKK